MNQFRTHVRGLGPQMQRRTMDPKLANSNALWSTANFCKWCAGKVRVTRNGVRTGSCTCYEKPKYMVGHEPKEDT